MHIPEKITLVPHHLIQAETKKQRKWIHWRQRLNPFRNSTKSVRTKIQQTIILEPALGRPNVSSSNSCWNLGKQRCIGGSKGSNTTSFGMSAMALPCGEYGLWRIVHITMDAVAYLIIEWPNISNQWPDNMAQHGTTCQNGTELNIWEHIPERSLSTRKPFLPSSKFRSECPDAFSDSMWNLAWRSNGTNHHEIISLHDVSKVVRVETACGLLPCVGLVSLNLGEVTTDELRHLRNISCSHVFSRFVKTTCWRQKKDVVTKKESHAKQNCKDRLLHQPSLWSCGVVRMLWISFFTHLSTRSTCSEI